jgi:hypothetical protein
MARSTGARKRDAQGRLTYGALAELFLRAGPSQRVAGTSPYTFDHFRRFFGRRLPEPSTIVGYVRRRQKEGAALQTINEELWSLAWMFDCAVQQGKLKQEDRPKIWFLREPVTATPMTGVRERPAWLRAILEPAAIPHAKVSSRPGKPLPLTESEFLANEGWKGSAKQRAPLLSRATSKRISEDQVQRMRERYQRPSK